MKKLLVFLTLNLLIVSIACSQKKKFPSPAGYINDLDNIFTLQQRKSLDSMVTAFEKETTVEIAILTIDDSWCKRERFDSLAIAIHNEWGVGKKKKNNGILIVICNAFKKIRINNGHGIEAKMTDAETKQIIDNEILPEYRNGSFYEGTRRGLLAVMKEVR